MPPVGAAHGRDFHRCKFLRYVPRLQKGCTSDPWRSIDRSYRSRPWARSYGSSVQLGEVIRRSAVPGAICSFPAKSVHCTMNYPASRVTVFALRYKDILIYLYYAKFDQATDYTAQSARGPNSVADRCVVLGDRVQCHRTDSGHVAKPAADFAAPQADL